MIRINYRFLAVVLVCSVLVAGGIHALHYVQSRRSAHFYLAKARAAEQDKNLPEALDLFRRYLQLVPNDPDALAEYGISLAERCAHLLELRRPRTPQEDEELRKSLLQAYGVLERVLRSQPDRENQVALRRSLARVAMYLRRFKDALEQLEKPAMAASQDWKLLEMKAICQEKTGEKIKAVVAYDEAIQLAPDQLDVYPERARLYHEQATLLRSLASDQLKAYRETAKSLRGLDRPKRKDSTEETLDPRQDADCYIETMVRKNPASALAYLLSARYWYALAAAGGAATDVSLINEWIKRATDNAGKAVELAPDNADALLLGAELALGKGVQDEARKYAERAIKAAPRDYRSYRLLAGIEWRNNAPQKAIEWLQAGLKELPDNPQLLFPLAAFLVDQGNKELEAAKNAIQRLKNVPAEQWLQPEQAKPTVDYLLGRLDYLQGNWADAKENLESASAGLTANDNLLRSAQYWLGSSYGQLAAVSKQRDEKQQLVEKQLATYRRARGSDGTGIQARLAAARTLAAIGRVDEAIEEQRVAQGLPGAPPAGWLQLAAWLIQRNRNLQPPDRDWREVERALKAAEDAGVGSPDLPLRYAEMWAMRGDSAKAEKVLQEAQGKQLKRPAQDPERKRPDFWIVLAGLAQQQQAALPPEKQDWSSTEAILHDAEKELGDSVALRLARARYVLRRYGDKAAPELLKLAENTGKLPEPDQAQLLGSLAQALLQLDKLAEATRLSQGAAEKQPDNLEIRLLQFDMAARAQDQRAMEALAGKIRKLDARGDRWRVAEAIRLRLVAQKLPPDKKQEEEKRLLDEALKHLVEARKLNPDWSRVPLLMAEIYDQLGQSPSALQNYREAIDQGERNVAVIQRTVQILYAQPSLDAAEQAEKLIQQLAAQTNLPASDVSAVMRQAPEFSLRPEVLPQALEMARKAAGNSKDYRDHLWLGQALMVAAAQDLAAQRADAAKTKLEEAEQALRRGNHLDPKAPAAWIPLMRFLARTGRGEEALKMIPQVQQNVPQDQLARVMPLCYEAVGNPENVEKAAKLYEAGLAKTPADLDLRRQAVEFYLRYGQSRLAQAQLEEILAGRAPAGVKDLSWARRQLALVLRFSRNDQDRQRALKMIDQNLALEPQSVDDRRAKAVVLASHPKRGTTQEAIGILEGLLEEKAATPEDRFLLFQLYLTEKEPAQVANDEKGTPKPPGSEPARKNWDRAKEIMLSLLASRPGEPRYLAAYIGALLKRGETSKAETTEAAILMGRLELLAPKQPGTLTLQAELLFANRKYEEAIARVKDILGTSTGFPERALVLLSTAASLHQFAGRLTTPESKADAEKFEQEAQSCLNQALDLAERAGPQADPLVVANFASRLLGMGTAKPARLQRLNAVLDSALKEQKRPIPLLLVLADLRTAEERFDEVEAIYGEILRGNGDNVVALNNLAVLLALRGKRLDEAAKMMDKAIKLMSPNPNPTLLDSRAMVAAASGHRDQALADLNRAIEEDPRPAPFFHRALLHLQNGQPVAALEDWNNARRLGMKEESLHPLERGMYGKLKDSLKQK